MPIDQLELQLHHIRLSQQKYILLHIIWRCARDRDMHFPKMTSKFLPENENRSKQALGTEVSFSLRSKQA